MVKVGVVGLGSMGQNHARVYSELDCCLVSVADTNPERAREIGEKYRVPYYYDYHELIDRVDAVSVVVPTVLHHRVATDFLKAGVSCLVEKPIAFCLEEAEDMIETAERNDVNLAVGLIEQFNPAVLKLKQVIEEGALGNLLIISTRRAGPFVSRITDVGAIIDTATHDIGVVKYLVGREPTSIFSRVGSQRHTKEDHGIIVLDFGGTTACIEVNWFSAQKVRTLVATGSERVAYLDYIGQNLTLVGAEGAEIINVQKSEPLKLELQDFLHSVEHRRRPTIDGEEGKAVLRISLECSRNNYCSLYEMAR